MEIAFTLLLVFMGTVLLTVGTYAFINRRRLEAVEATRVRLMGSGATGPVSILKDDRVSGLGFLNRMLAGRSFTDALAAELMRAGSKEKVGEFLLKSALAAGVGLLIGQRFAGFFVGLLGAIVTGVIPFLLLKRKQKKRMSKFEEQLPDAIDMLVNALKAGYSLQAAMEFVGKEVPDPLGPEFGRFYDQQRLGVEVRTALLAMQERVGTPDVKMFVTSLLIQRETGGNLSEVLNNLATLIRDRVAFRGLVKTLTAEPAMSANVMALLPLGIFFILSTLNRNYMRPLWTTSGGRLTIVYSIVSILIGYIIMKRMADIEM